MLRRVLSTASPVLEHLARLRRKVPQGQTLLLALACASACARAPKAPPLPPIDTSEVVAALLDAGLPTILRQSEHHPVKYDLMMPCGSGSKEFGEMSALEMTPPCEVRFQVPDFPADSELSFAVAIRKQAYAGQGRVSFQLEQNGKELWSKSISSSADVPDEERRWWPDRLRITPGSELVVRTSYEGSAPRPPRAGIGLLEIVRRKSIPRRHASADGVNLLLILVDTLRADGLGTYGKVPGVSPNLDALAERGTLFLEAYSSAPWTVPSTATVLTGLSVAEHGLGFSASNYLAHGLLTIAEALQAEGWSTGGFSCNTLISSSRNFSQGFEHFRDYRWKNAAGMIGDVERWIEENREHRFFAYLHVVDPHGPYLPEEPHRSRFAPDVPDDFQAQPSVVMDDFWRGVHPPEYLANYAQQARALYNGEVAWLDELLGRLIQHMESLGVLENTVIALTSDHGEEFHEHGLLGHVAQLHAELVQVPLFLAGPGVAAGKRIEQPVENRFLAPTLLKLAGVKARGNLRGYDLLDKGDLRDYDGDPIFFATRTGRMRLADSSWSKRRSIYGARHEGWRFFWAPGTEAEPEELMALFDVRADPAALKNIAAEQPETCQRLRELIRQWLERSREIRPTVRLSGEADFEEMRGLGYVGED